jgi:phosphoglycerate dehydrogenase-like enzyme
VRERDAAMHAGMWRDRSLEGTYVARRTADDYPGITLGLVGLGRIARRVCQLFAPWNFRILAYDPYVEDATFERAGAERVDLETLLKESDVVSMHVVSTRETRGMMSTDQFALMKPDAIFVNTSRGDVVDEPALVRALEDDRIAGAALDVYLTEPLPAGSPLRKLGKKVMFSAHMVSMNQGGGISQGYQWATQSVLRALNGEEVIDRWSERFAGRRMLTVNEPFDVGFRHPGVPE